MTAAAQAVPANPRVAVARQEHWLIFSNLFVALAAGAMASWSAPMMLAVLYVDIWLLANPHIVATYVRIKALSSHARIYWFLVAVAPILVAVGLTVVALAYEAAGLFALYFALQAFHVSRQSHGIARRYDHRPHAPRHGLPCFLIYLFPVWGYLHRSAQAPDSFLGYPIWLPPVAQELAHATGIAAGIAALSWCVCLVYRRAARKESRVVDGFILSHLLVSWVGYVWINDITIGWLVVNVWHNIQYLIFVYRQRPSDAAAMRHEVEPIRGWEGRVKWARAPMAAVPFFLACSVVGAAFYTGAGIVGESLLWLGLPTVLIAHFILNFHHYLADSMVWKRPRSGA